ncbi:MAG: signal peptide peptidase SppA [Planctomycetota bacterium]|nr:MAG: signal peptide peptidase SppA [Planctomycetota bacterium]
MDLGDVRRVPSRRACRGGFGPWAVRPASCADAWRSARAQALWRGGILLGFVLAAASPVAAQEASAPPVKRGLGLGPSLVTAAKTTPSVEQKRPEKDGRKTDAQRQAAEPKTANVAQIVLHGMYTEAPQPLGLFTGIRDSLSEVVGRFDRAAKDERVRAVVVLFKTPILGWGQMYELQSAIERVRASGKPVYAWVESATGLDYVLASQCDRVWMPEGGMLLLTGLRVEVTFYKRLLEKIGAKADMLRMGKYKSAAEPFTREDMSPEFREQMEALLDDRWQEMLRLIASGRKLSEARVREIIDAGPYSARRAADVGLLDAVAYADEIADRVASLQKVDRVRLLRGYGRKELDTDFSGPFGPLKLFSMLLGVRPTARPATKPRIAVIYAEGPIMPGRSSADLLLGSTIGSDTMVKAIRTARDDKSVKAIVLRVNSPGGSALASDLIWRALEDCGKPVVVSMSDVAGSGGYYIAMGADAIFAAPGTITGSIGVVSGKLAFGGTLEKLGITTAVLSRGKNAGLLSIVTPLNDSERRALQRLNEDMYRVFVRKAAEGRGMPVERMEQLAQGRIYSGLRAKELGLVDRIGSLEDAVRHAKQLAGLPEDAEVERLTLPQPVSPLDVLFGTPEDRTGARVSGVDPFFDLAVRAFAHAVPTHRGLLATARALIELSREPVLCVMPCAITIR